MSKGAKFGTCRLYEEAGSRVPGFFSRFVEQRAIIYGYKASILMESDGGFEAQVETVDAIHYRISVATPFVKLLASIYDAIGQVRDSGPYSTYLGLAKKLRLKNLPNLRHLTHARSGLQSTLSLATYASVLFIFLHELAHVEEGHCRYLFSLIEREGDLARLRFNEARPLTRLRRASSAGGPAPEFSKHLEMEADLRAFVSLVSILEEVCVPALPAGALKTDQPHREDEALSMQLTEIAFYSALICFCLFEIVRQKTGASRSYPKPLTRALSIYRQFVIMTKSSWKMDGRFIVGKYNFTEIDRYSWVAVNALSTIDFISQITNTKLSDAYALSEDATYLNDMLSAGMWAMNVNLVTAEGIELARLDKSRPKFMAKMAIFRYSVPSSTDSGRFAP